MNFIKKYKNYSKRILISINYPTKILSFESLKWRNVKIQLLKKNKHKIKYIKKVIYKKRKKLIIKKKLIKFIVNPLIKISTIIRIKYRIQYLKDKNFYNNKLILYYNNLKLLKPIYFSNNSKIKKIKNYLLNPLFNSKILLWLLSYSSSIKNVIQDINKVKINLNNEVYRKSKILNKGSMLVFDKYFDKTLNRKLYIKNNSIFSFIEIDYYINVIIIIKEFKELNLNDNFLQIGDYFNLTLLSKHK